MKVLMSELKEKLASVPGVNFVDEDWGQLDAFSSQAPVKWPCVLISMQSGTYTEVGRERNNLSVNRQMGEILVELRIANLKVTPSGQRASANQKANSVSVLEIFEQVHRHIHGWTPGHDNSNTNFNGKFIRQRFRNERRDDGIQEYSVIYSISVTSS